jgi:2Fe-2S ferredoxin
MLITKPINQKLKTTNQKMQDINIKITDRNGVTHNVVAPTDMAMNLMEVVRSYELAEEGTIGICGGMAMCASCQCYVESDHELPEISDDEDAMLAEAFHVEDNSRLGCQIQMTPEINGLEVVLAPES